MDKSINTLRTLFEAIREGLGVNATIGLFMDEDRLYLQIGFRNVSDINVISPYTVEITADLKTMKADHLISGIIEDCIERNQLVIRH
jgi:hypothetical protein